MSSFLTVKLSTFPGATWLFEGVGWRPLTDLIRNFGKPGMMWISAGERENKAENSDSVPEQWSGITIAGRYERTGNSRSVTEKPKPCSKENGRKNTIRAATPLGRDAYM